MSEPFADRVARGHAAGRTRRVVAQAIQKAPDLFSLRQHGDKYITESEAAREGQFCPSSAMEASSAVPLRIGAS